MIKNIISLFLFLMPLYLVGMSNEHPQRELAVFFTNIEGVGRPNKPLSKQASYALHQKSFPILIQKDVLYNAIFGSDLINHNAIVDKIIFGNKIQFSFNDWIVRKKGMFFLMVPTSYIFAKKIESKIYTKKDEETLTDLEIGLGLKIDHLEAISNRIRT